MSKAESFSIQREKKNFKKCDETVANVALIRGNVIQSLLQGTVKMHEFRMLYTEKCQNLFSVLQ